MQFVKNFFKQKPKSDEPSYIEDITDRVDSCWAKLPTDMIWVIFNVTDDDLAGIYRSRRVCKDWKNTIEGFTGFWEQQAK